MKTQDTRNKILNSLLTSSVVILLPVALPAQGTANQPAQPATWSAAIPLDQVGAVAGKQYSGDGLAVVATPQGAHLRCVFQKLEGEATSEGLWLASTVTNGTTERLRVKAVAVGRASSALSTLNAQSSAKLPSTGTITVKDERVRFIRPGLVEEYSVRMDGVRQDFIISSPPLNPQPLGASERNEVVLCPVKGFFIKFIHR